MLTASLYHHVDTSSALEEIRRVPGGPCLQLTASKSVFTNYSSIAAVNIHREGSYEDNILKPLSDHASTTLLTREVRGLRRGLFEPQQARAPATNEPHAALPAATTDALAEALAGHQHHEGGGQRACFRSGASAPTRLTA